MSVHAAGWLVKCFDCGTTTTVPDAVGPREARVVAGRLGWVTALNRADVAAIDLCPACADRMCEREVRKCQTPIPLVSLSEGRAVRVRLCQLPSGHSGDHDG